jgi:hypothetical protein
MFDPSTVALPAGLLLVRETLREGPGVPFDHVPATTEVASEAAEVDETMFVAKTVTRMVLPTSSALGV